MRFTKYGQQRANSERLYEPKSTGAQAAAETMAYDVGQRYICTGKDAHGKRIRREARSIQGAYFMMEAMWGVSNVWHVTPSGRKLCIQR